MCKKRALIAKNQGKKTLDFKARKGSAIFSHLTERGNRIIDDDKNQCQPVNRTEIS